MAILLDIAIVIIFVVTCITGYCLGLVKYAAMMLRTVLTVAVAGVVAFTCASPVYNAVAADKAVSSIERTIEKIDIISIMEQDLRKKGLPQSVTNDDLREAVLADGDVSYNMRIMLAGKGVDSVLAEKIVGELDAYVDNELFERIHKLTSKNGFVSIGLENEREALVSFVRMLIPSDKHMVAVQLEESYVRPFGLIVTGAALFVITAVVVSLVLIIIVKVAGLLSGINIVSAANSFGGLALGVVKGICYALLAAFILSLIVESSNDQLGKLNTSIIDNTYLFRYFFRVFYK